MNKFVMGLMLFLSNVGFAASDDAIQQALGTVSIYSITGVSPLLATTVCIMEEFDHGTGLYLVACTPTHTALESTDRVLHREVLVAAKDDAAIFVAADAKAEKSAVLQNAFESIHAIPEFAALSEKEMAQVVLVLNDQMNQ